MGILQIKKKQNTLHVPKFCGHGVWFGAPWFHGVTRAAHVVICTLGQSRDPPICCTSSPLLRQALQTQWKKLTADGASRVATLPTPQSADRQPTSASNYAGAGPTLRDLMPKQTRGDQPKPKPKKKKPEVKPKKHPQKTSANFSLALEEGTANLMISDQKGSVNVVGADLSREDWSFKSEALLQAALGYAGGAAYVELRVNSLAEKRASMRFGWAGADPHKSGRSTELLTFSNRGEFRVKNEVVQCLTRKPA